MCPRGLLWLEVGPLDPLFQSLISRAILFLFDLYTGFWIKVWLRKNSSVKNILQIDEVREFLFSSNMIWNTKPTYNCYLNLFYKSNYSMVLLMKNRMTVKHVSKTI